MNYFEDGFRLAVMADYSRITIRLNPDEEPLFSAIMSDLRKRAGAPIQATTLVKALMGFETELLVYSDDDRKRLKPKSGPRLARG